MLSILIGGDFVPQNGSPKNMFADPLLNQLKDKDFSIINLEVPLTICNRPILKTGNNFKAHTDMVKHIVNGYFDAVALSNNHIRDFGDEGVTDTLNICKESNIKTVGAGLNLFDAKKPLRVTLKGKNISFLNYSEHEFNIASKTHAGANPFNIIEAFNDINEEKKWNDYVIVIYHGGLEYHHLPSPEIVKLFKFLIESGADCVVSHHTHRYSGLIYHHNKPILFGLGNFLSSTKTKNTEGWLTGLVAKIRFENNNVIAEMIPTQMEPDFSAVSTMSELKNQIVLNHVSELSQIISNEKKLQEYWEQEYEKFQKQLINILRSDSRFEYRLRKNFPVLFKPGISRYKLLNVLNLVRCSSHRGRLINVLEDLYKKIGDQ